jgi:hypothetical protein
MVSGGRTERSALANPDSLARKEGLAADDRFSRFF